MKISIIGLGHMGSWLTNMLAENHSLCVYDSDPSRKARCQNARSIDTIEEIKSFEPELLINAVSLHKTIEVFESVMPYLPASCILSDMASVKGKIPEYYRSCGFRFVSIHPMFGPTFANVERLGDENVIIIDESDKEGAAFFRDFFDRLGLKTHTYSFEEHDRMIAYSLALPFSSTIVFAACMDNTAVPGTTFKKHLEIARGLLSEDDYLLCEILFNPYAFAQLEKVSSRLEFLKHVIKEKDGEEAERFLARLRENIR